MKKTIAELQADKRILEQDIAVLKTRTDEAGKSSLAVKEAQLQACDANITSTELQAADTKRKEADADAAIAAMESKGLLPMQGADAAARKAQYRQTFIEKPDMIQTIAGEALKGGASASAAGAQLPLVAGRVAPVAGALTAVDGRINKFQEDPDASYNYEPPVQAGFSAKDALAGYFELVNVNTKCAWNPNDRERQERKHKAALAAANWYGKFLAKETKQWENIPGVNIGQMCGMALKAADYADPNVATYSNLGTLTGTLVLQRCLPNFAYKYPEIFKMTTDFSDAPGLYNQTETTRIITQPPVQTYSSTLASAGAYGQAGTTQGWTTAVEGVGTDVSITLNNYVAVPIAVGNNIIAATNRRLFEEQAPLAVKAIAAYLMGMVTNLMTAATFNSFATANATTVPNAYATFPVTRQNMSASRLDELDAAFTSIKAPEEDRVILLNPAFFALLRQDPRLWFMYAASAKNSADAGDFLSKPVLPEISGFTPYKAGYMPTSTPSTNPTTSNVVGFAFQKAGLIVKSRLPQDFTAALNAPVPGSITTVVDPDTKMSLMLVQYINLQQNYAEWRPEVMLGAAAGDPRAGLVITGS